MSEIEKIFEDLQKNPNTQEQTFKKLSHLIKNGSLINEIQQILGSTLVNHISIKPFILIFLNDFVLLKNKNLSKNSDLLIYLNSIIEIILEENLDFSLKKILGKSITILSNQIDKGNLDFIFSNFLNDFLNLKFLGKKLEGAVIILNHFFKSFNIIGGNLNLKIIENIFSDSKNFENFLLFLKNIFFENSLPNFEKYFFEDFLSILISYLNKIDFLKFVIDKSKFFYLLLEIINEIPRENNIFKLYSLKIVLKIAKFLINSKNCSSKHIFYTKFSKYLENQISEFFENLEKYPKNYKIKITKSILYITKNPNSKSFIKKNLEKILKKIIFPELITKKNEKIDSYENPSEFIYYKFDCIDTRKSKTEKTYIFEILDNLVDEISGLYEFLIKSFLYLSDSLINSKKINFDEFFFLDFNLKIFDFFENQENFVEACFLILACLCYKIDENSFLVEIIDDFILRNLLKFFENDYENKFFVISSFFLFFTFSSDLILQENKNNIFYEKILDYGFLYLENSKNENIINLQIIFSFEKIINEEKIFLYIKKNIEKINYMLLQKLEIFNFQEYFKFFKKIINCSDSENLNLNLIILFLEKIIFEIEKNNNEFSIYNLFQILSMYINRLNFENSQNNEFFIFDQKMKIIINYLKKNQFLSVSKEILIIFEKLVKKKIFGNFSFLEYFLDNICEIFKNIEDCKYLFYLILENFSKIHFEILQKKKKFFKFINKSNF